MTPIEIEGRFFVKASEVSIPECSSVARDHSFPSLTLKNDDLFLITDSLGNIVDSDCQKNGLPGNMGLFCRDTRFLNHLELQIEGRSPVLLGSDAHSCSRLRVLCANPIIDDHLLAETISIQREIVLNGSLFEEISITNYSRQPTSFMISLSFDSDFIDLFEVRGFSREKRGTLLRVANPPLDNNNLESPDTTIEGDHNQIKEITLAYLGLDNYLMESVIHFEYQQPDQIKGYTAIWNLHLESHETKTLGYRLQLLVNNRPASDAHAPVTIKQAKAAQQVEEQIWLEEITQIRSDNKNFNQILKQAEQDIFQLRQSFEQNKAICAGVPWFSTLFGRDSLIAASQTLMLDPAIAKETLYVLAKYQGQVDDDWREEEPGKILHEIRLGEMARCHEIPHTPYYGSIDATPLWLMLYAEYFVWTQDRETLDNLWENALAAMEWIDRNCPANGYLSYNRRSHKGLINQGWKDSGDCIVNRLGDLAKAPIALCEVQAYVYAAKIRLSEIALLRKEYQLVDRWQKEARDLKSRFNRDFWLADQGYLALALDGNGEKVDSITSNPGQCLYLGILYPDQAHSVAERLRAADMFNGWGIRTLSSLSPAYNPMGYHLGSVWPHDNGMIAIGLRSMGLLEQSLEIAQGVIDMTLEQPYQRPPELFCGYERSYESRPVNYPVACSPQAWATGTIFQLVQMMVNLVPDAPSNCLRIIEPSLLKSINHLTISNLKIGQTVLDLEFERSNETVACKVMKKRGNLRVFIET